MIAPANKAMVWSFLSGVLAGALFGLVTTRIEAAGMEAKLHHEDYPIWWLIFAQIAIVVTGFFLGVVLQLKLIKPVHLKGKQDTRFGLFAKTFVAFAVGVVLTLSLFPTQ
jgi:hypothetical protein